VTNQSGEIGDTCIGLTEVRADDQESPLNLAVRVTQGNTDNSGQNLKK